MIKNLLRHKVELGLVLQFLCIQIVQVIRLYTERNDNYVTIFMILSLLMIFNFHGKLHINKQTFFLMAYQIIVIIMAVFAGASMLGGPRSYSYTVFTLGAIIAMSTNKRIDGEFFIKTLWVVSGTAVLIAMYYFMTNDVWQFNSVTTTGDELIVDRANMGVLPVVSLITIFVYRPKIWPVKIFNVLFAICSFYVLTIVNRRGLFISIILILVLHLFLNGAKNRITINPKKMLIGVLIVVGCMIAYYRLPSVQEQLDRVIESVERALRTFTGQATGSEADMSSEIRYNLRSRILDEMRNFTFVDWLIGKGYNAGWIDFPFLQCFYDMGIPLGVFYILLQTIIPFRFIILKRENAANYEKLLFYLFLMNYINNFYSGTPYGIPKFMYVIPFYMDWMAVKRNELKGVLNEKKD